MESTEPLAPTHLYAHARRLNVDLTTEPFLLPLVRQAATTPLLLSSPHWAADENQLAGAGESYFQQQISELRARHAGDPQPTHAWVEFEESNGAVYYFDFVSESRRDTHPLVQLLDSAIGGGESAANVADPKVFERATALHKLTSVKNLEQLEILCFHAWWTELSLQGTASKRLAHIYFSVPTHHFQVVIEDADDVFTISHIVGPSGRPLAAWDLHVGARITVLGRLTTLMQASLLTRQWLQLHERRLGETKRQLQTELAKYELKAHGRPHQAGRIECVEPHRSQTGCSLRQLLDDITSLKRKLAGYRPDLARRICTDLPDVDDE